MVTKPTPKPTPTGEPTIPSFGDFQSTQGATSGGTGSTAAGDFPATTFGLTGSGLSGITTPDRIDNPNNVLTITNTVGVQSLPPEELASLQASLKQAGLTPDGFQVSGVLDDDTKRALLSLKRDASASGMSDLDALRTRITMAAQAATAEGAAGEGPSRSVSKTISDPVFTDPITARGVLRDAWAQRFGRAPTADEFHNFRQQLSSSESGQDVTTNITTSDGQGHSTTRVKRSDNTTDPSAGDIADDMSRKGALGREANTVSAANYYDVIARRIGG